MITISRDIAVVRLAGHPPPVALWSSTTLTPPVGLPLGVGASASWPAQPFALPPGWALLLYTDGLIEGQVDGTEDRLGSARLADKATALLASTDDAASIVPALVEYAESLHGGPLPDDVGALLLTYLPT
jgi:serine phosphatase RsbU (regulator of sigma subunit)